MTRKLKRHLADRNKHWKVTQTDNDLITVICKRCQITPEAIKQAVHDFMNHHDLDLIGGEDCPIAGILVGSAKLRKPRFIQATTHNRALATIRVAAT